MSAVITGLGVAAPTGLGTGDYWSATLRGQAAIGRISRFDASRYPARLAGEVPEYEAAEHLPSRLIPQTDQVTRLALMAGEWALQDADVDPKTMPEYEMGVVTASSSGGFEFGHRELENLWRKGPQFVSAYQSFAWFYAVNTGQLSIRHGMRGHSGVIVSEGAGGLDAIAQARRSVAKGVRLVMTGGVDASLCPWGWAMQVRNGLMSVSEDASRAYLPFDVGANGYVAGEGGAILVVEDETSARARAATQLYGRIAGYAATFDPAPGTGREPGLYRAARLALQDADAQPEDVDVVFADAAGVRAADADEAEAIVRLFGPHAVPVTAPKTMTGRMYSGAAAVDVAAALLSMRDGVIPPTVNVGRPDPEFRLDLVTEARHVPVRTALVLARGHGGYNSALLLQRAA